MPHISDGVYGQEAYFDNKLDYDYYKFTNINEQTIEFYADIEGNKINFELFKEYEDGVIGWVDSWTSEGNHRKELETGTFYLLVMPDESFDMAKNIYNVGYSYVNQVETTDVQINSFVFQRYELTGYTDVNGKFKIKLTGLRDIEDSTQSYECDNFYTSDYHVHC